MQPEPTIVMRTEHIRVLRDMRGLTDDRALALAMQIDRSSVSRVMRGKQAPGPKFIASLCIALGASMNDLFAVDEGRLAS